MPKDEADLWTRQNDEWQSPLASSKQHEKCKVVFCIRAIPPFLEYGLIT